MNPSGQLAPLSVFSPAGAAPLIETHRRPVPLRVRRLLIPMGLTLILLLSLRAVGSQVTILTDSSAQDPWLRFTPPVVLTTDHASAAEMWIPSTAFLTQVLYAVSGLAFLSLWLWRGRRVSQGYLLALAIPLLGLAALGVSLGFGGPSIRMLSRLPLLAVAYMWMAQILCGAAMLLAGLLDHWQLVRTLRHPLTPLMEEPS